MKSEDLKNTDVEQEVAKPVPATSTHIVTADSVQAEEVPTIPIGSLETISTLQPEISVRAVRATRSVNIPTPLVVQPEEYRRSLGEWLQIWRDGMRTGYLPLSLMPVLLGSVLAWLPTVSKRTLVGHFNVPHFLLMLAAIILLQLGANLVNDYYDYMHGIDTSNAFGPGGLIQQGMIKPSRILYCGLMLLILGAVLGLIVAQAGGPLVYLFGLLGVVGAYFYSATARPLSSLGLGEVVGFIIYGPLITLGAYMVQTGGKFSSTPFIYSLPLGLLAAAVIHANNMRDIESDMHVSKYTLVTLTGLRWSRAIFLILILAAYAIIIALGVPHGAPHLILLTLWTFPLIVVMLSGIVRTNAPAGFHQIMRQTLKLMTLFTIFLVIALAANTLIPLLPGIPTHILPF